ncbi:MAG: ATP-dependent protease ATPase subunit HslU [Thermoguttaceae bacterium]|nr:ATP-dependent protease ATPase subunit HslU [Thermoguttaceae bacterium]
MNTKIQELTPREIVQKLDAHIVGQTDAKRAVAIAVRNRWRRQQLPEEQRKEISPKNILMIGPTGVGKTELARRLAKLTNAPFVKVEATKYTEVGYYGRDVESMIRELVENGLSLVRSRELERVKADAEAKVEERLLDLLEPLSEELPDLPPLPDSLKDDGEDVDLEIHFDEDVPATINERIAGQFSMSELAEMLRTLRNAHTPKEIEETIKEIDEDLMEAGRKADAEVKKRARASREVLRSKLKTGLLEDQEVEIPTPKKNSPPFMMMGAIGSDSLETGLSEMLGKMLPRKTVRRKVPIREARKILMESECDAMLDDEKIQAEAVELAENTGIIFIDEIDKIVASNTTHGADVSRQGVQRDLLPIVEGTTIQTRYGYVKTDHILFIAAGAFHQNKPGDLMPELQGRFPIRVELHDLTKEDFCRILKEPENALLSQYQALLKTEGVEIKFLPEAVDALADYAWRVNQTSQNIGARRLYTILERLLEDVSFEAAESPKKQVRITAAYVRKRLEDVTQDEDLSRFIL